MSSPRTLAALVLAAGLAASSAAAQDNSAAQANNPLAEIKSLNFQNYYIGELTGDGDLDANQFVLRYAQPISIGRSDWLVRASIPVNSFPLKADGDWETGLGDINVFATYLIDTGNPNVSFGIGPSITAPSATEDGLGADQWQIGIANVYFNAESPKFQYGYLLTYSNGIGDTGDDERVMLGALQPFGFYQLGQGWYTGMAPIWSYDFQSDDFSVPLGARIGKVVKTEKVVYNMFLEPQYSVWDRGDGLPEWQVFGAVNLQFK